MIVQWDEKIIPRHGMDLYSILQGDQRSYVLLLVRIMKAILTVFKGLLLITLLVIF